jgi:hypothetical protein
MVTHSTQVDGLEYLSKEPTSLKMNEERKTYMLFVLYNQIGSLIHQTFACLARVIEESLFYSLLGKHLYSAHKWRTLV